MASCPLLSSSRTSSPLPVAAAYVRFDMPASPSSRGDPACAFGGVWLWLLLLPLLPVSMVFAVVVLSFAFFAGGGDTMPADMADFGEPPPEGRGDASLRFLVEGVADCSVVPSKQTMEMLLRPRSMTCGIEALLLLSVDPFVPQLTKQGTHSLQPLRSFHECLPAEMRSVISFQPPARWCAPASMKRPLKHEPQLEQARSSTEKASPDRKHDRRMLRTTASLS
mmetsp:Transcript_38363/g.93346  ORF Transcript_38363/g.93346 Transcript_38363/m.93346 type:complete len:223 (-) Transcript_38363:646-1314(-)